jgi:hypothetical protein
LTLAASCRLLSDRARSDGDALTAVTLDQLSSHLADQAAILAALLRVEPSGGTSPCPAASSPDPDAGLAALDARLCRAALVAESDAMSPGLEGAVAGLLSVLAALYQTRRQLLLVSNVLDGA